MRQKITKKAGIQKTRHVRKTAGRQKQRSRQNGSGQAAANADAIREPGLHLLGELGSITKFEIDLMTGTDPDMPGFMEMIDTEKKQLQAIEDLYAIVKAQPKYKNLKEPNWNADTSPIKILKWLLRKLGPLAEGKDWTIDTWQDGRKIRYQFVVLNGYNGNHFKDEEYFIPLEFLPFLKKRDSALHDLIVDVVAMVVKNCKVPLWDTDGDFSLALQGMSDIYIDQKDNGFLANQLRAYMPNGIANLYLRLIKRRCRHVNTIELKKRIDAYDDKSIRKRIAKWWLRKGFHLTTHKKDLTKIGYVPNYAEGDPVTPFRMYKFIWSMHKNDSIKAQAYQRISTAERKWGRFSPKMFGVTKPGQKLKKPVFDQFPIDLYEFMRLGENHFAGNEYFKYYYRKSDQMETKTPSAYLIDIIPPAEFDELTVFLNN